MEWEGKQRINFVFLKFSLKSRGLWFFIVCPMEMEMRYQKLISMLSHSLHNQTQHIRQVENETDKKNILNEMWMRTLESGRCDAMLRRSWMLISYSWRSHISVNINGYEGWHSSHLPSRVKEWEFGEGGRASQPVSSMLSVFDSRIENSIFWVVFKTQQTLNLLSRSPSRYFYDDDYLPKSSLLQSLISTMIFCIFY
jgi:hypothetical protein